MRRLHYLRALRDVDNWAAIRQAYNATIVNRTQIFNNDALTDFCESHTNPATEYGSAVWFTRTLGKQEYMAEISSLIQHAPSSFNLKQVISAEAVLLGARMPPSWRFLPHGRANPNKVKIHAQYSEFVREATRFAHGSTSLSTTTTSR